MTKTGESMKQIIATAFFLAATPAFGAGLAEPIVAPEVIAADTVATSDKLDGAFTAIFAILLLLNIAGALN